MQYNDGGMMKEQYELRLSPSRLKRNKVLAIHIMAAILLVVIGFLTIITPFSIDIFTAGKGMGIQPFTWVNATGILFVIVGIAIILMAILRGRWLQQAYNNQIVRGIELLSFSCIAIYSLLNHWYVPAAYGSATVLAIVIAWYFEKKAAVKTKITLNEEGIYSNKHLWQKWNKVKSLVIKYNVLSIRLTNGKMYQMILDTVAKNANEIMEYGAKKIPESIESSMQEDW